MFFFFRALLAESSILRSATKRNGQHSGRLDRNLFFGGRFRGRLGERLLGGFGNEFCRSRRSAVASSRLRLLHFRSRFYFRGSIRIERTKGLYFPDGIDATIRGRQFL